MTVYSSTYCRRFLVSIVVVFSFAITHKVIAAPGDIDLTFDPDMGANNMVSQVVIQSDGRIIIGGSFTSYNGTARNRIARLNADGSLDPSFDPGVGANGTVNAITIQSDNKILIGGSFTSYNGTVRNRIARVNTNGSLDTTFNPGTGVDDAVGDIAIQSDGKIIIVGDFFTYNGIARWKIARVNTNGSLDTIFDPDGANQDIRVVEIQSDGKIIVAGLFTAFNGTVRNRIARVNTNGSLDTTFNPGTGPDNHVLAMTIQSDGKILIGGFFNYYNGAVRNYFARVNTNGSLDTTYNPGTGIDAGFGVRAIAIQSDNTILIGGSFTSYNGTMRNRIARVNTNGSLDTTFDPGTGLDNHVRAIAIQSDDEIVIVGDFSMYNTINRNHITRILHDDSVTTPSVVTQLPSGVTGQIATGRADVVNTGGQNPDRIIEWGVVSGVYTHECSAGVGAIGTYECLMSLVPNTTYYVRAKVVNAAGVGYGSEQSFTTTFPNLYPRMITTKGMVGWKGFVKIK